MLVSLHDEGLYNFVDIHSCIIPNACLRKPGDRSHKLDLCHRLKEQQLKEAKQNAAVVDKGRESAERASESARQAKQKSDSELARLQNLITELEQSKR